MAHINGKLLLDFIEITTDWIELRAMIDCNQVELTSDVQFEWATDKTKEGASRLVDALVREPLVLGRAWGASARFKKDDRICYVRGKQLGRLWFKLSD